VRPTTGANLFQNPERYEQTLSRHGQFVRWVRAVLCPCLTQSGQPDIRCRVCGGRGRIFTVPTSMSVSMEEAQHNNQGLITVKSSRLIPGTAEVRDKSGNVLPLSVPQPGDGVSVQLAPPYPKTWERVCVNYEFTPVQFVVGENSEVVGENTLRVRGARFTYNGKTYEGAVTVVSRVYNVTKDETYTVAKFAKEFISLSDMGSWVAGDILEVDFQYMPPFNFGLSGVSQKKRYESTWVMDQATAILVTPYWAKPVPDDLFTTLMAEAFGQMIIDPRAREGTDIIKQVFDVSRITSLTGADGLPIPLTNVQLYGRNEIKWLVTKPVQKYTVQYTYHPTYVALGEYSTLRTSENKEFVNRMNLMKFDNTDGRDW
jgi:hypothetical protein